MSYAKSITLEQAGTLGALLLSIAGLAAKYATEHGPRDMVWADVDLERPEPA